MRERPILFSAAMVRAILDGRKTQTRRVVQPPRGWGERYPNCDPYSMPPSVWWWDGKHDHVGVRHECPFGVPGDRLWVRESFMSAPMEAPPESPRRTRWDIVYAAGGAEERMAPAAYNPMLYNYERWTPSIHMPRWASRITLEVVSVRVERVQSIAALDAAAEGTTHSGFRLLWDSLNAKRGYGWDANPWVWRIEFRRVMPNASLTGAEPAGEASGRSDS